MKFNKKSKTTHGRSLKIRANQAAASKSKKCKSKKVVKAASKKKNKTHQFVGGCWLGDMLWGDKNKNKNKNSNTNAKVVANKNMLTAADAASERAKNMLKRMNANNAKFEQEEQRERMLEQKREVFLGILKKKENEQAVKLYYILKNCAFSKKNAGLFGNAFRRLETYLLNSQAPPDTNNNVCKFNLSPLQQIQRMYYDANGKFKNQQDADLNKILLKLLPLLGYSSS